MLSHSIGTVRAFFEDTAQYVVHTDNSRLVAANLLTPALVREYSSHLSPQFIDARSTWMKWAPRGRLDTNATEILLDSDVFLVNEPEELRSFCMTSSHRLLVAQEEFTALWPYGTFGPQLQDSFVPINAGIVGQQAGVDISSELETLYQSWKSRVEGDKFLYHDEQGAIALLLQPYCQRGEVMLLDSDRYRVVCPLNKVPVQCLDDLKVIHATYPDHPAFWRFLPEIAGISGLDVEIPIWRTG